MRAQRHSAWATFLVLSSLETNDCIVWPFAQYKKGYGMVTSEDKIVRTHVKALEMRTPRPFVGALALHGPCHNPSCMNYRHLYWGTQKRNHEDRHRDGTSSTNVGERNPRSILTWKQVRTMRAMMKAGAHNADLAKKFGCSRSLVSLIRSNKYWKDESWVPVCRSRKCWQQDTHREPVLKLTDQGLSQVDIAVRLGIDRRIVRSLQRAAA